MLSRNVYDLGHALSGRRAQLLPQSGQMCVLMRPLESHPAACTWKEGQPRLFRTGSLQWDTPQSTSSREACQANPDFKR